jgi:hypothetical protein
MFRWVTSELGRSMTLHPFRKGHFLGSGQGEMVLAEAGLDGKGQVKTIKKYVDALARQRPAAPRTVKAATKTVAKKKAAPKAKAKTKAKPRGRR